MRTDDLIDRLAAELSPVQPLLQPWQRTLHWLAAAGVGLAGIAFFTTLRPDLAGSFREPRFLIEFTAIAMTATLAALAAFASTVPGSSASVSVPCLDLARDTWRGMPPSLARGWWFWTTSYRGLGVSADYASGHCSAGIGDVGDVVPRGACCASKKRIAWRAGSNGTRQPWIETAACARHQRPCPRLAPSQPCDHGRARAGVGSNRAPQIITLT